MRKEKNGSLREDSTHNGPIHGSISPHAVDDGWWNTIENATAKSQEQKKGPRNVYCNTLLTVDSRNGRKRLFKLYYPKVVQVEYTRVNNFPRNNYSYYAPGGRALNYTQHYRNM
jgi:ATP-dependent helicase/DNAse subunit B